MNQYPAYNGKKKMENLPHFVQYTQTFHPFWPLEDDATTINNPAVSAHPCFLGCLSPSNAQCSFHLSLPLISLRLQMDGLTSMSDVHNLLTINPLVTLHQNAHAIYSELSNGCLVLDGIFEFLLLRILRKRGLGFSLGSIVARHW